MTLDFILYTIREGREEIDAGDPLHLIYRIDKFHGFLSSGRLISADETNSFRFSFHTEYDLEERFRYNYLVSADRLMLPAEQYRTAYDIDIPVFLCPFPASLLDRVP